MVLFELGGFEAGTENDTDIDSKEEEERIYSCIHCGSMVTTVKAEISVNGSFKHSFTNPHGFMYSIGCFAEAPGCTSMGLSTAEFSWFPGYAWRIGVCRSCGFHLGWEFSKESDYFYGLILTNLSGGKG